jgi:hypothetical protein
MQEYAENVLIPDVESAVDEYPLNRKDQKVLCLFDVFAANRTDSFKDKLDDDAGTNVILISLSSSLSLNESVLFAANTSNKHSTF